LKREREGERKRGGGGRRGEGRSLATLNVDL